MDVLNAILYTRDVRSELDSPEVKHLIREAVIVLRSALKELKGDALAVTSSAADGASSKWLLALVPLLYLCSCL